MAQIVLGIGSSHGPTMNTAPERWAALGERDQLDARFDFEALRANPRPEVAKQVNIETFTERYNKIQDDVKALEHVIRDAALDVVVVLSNPHGGITTDSMQATFGVHLNDPPPSVEGVELRQRMLAAGDEAKESPPEPSGPRYPTDGDLARHLMNGLIEEGIDVAACFQSTPGAGLDGAYNLLYQRYLTEADVPYVPVLVSRYLPNQATPKRSYQFGQALGRVIEAWDSDKRVGIMASGGLSHQIIDEDLDRVVVEALTSGDADTLGALSREALNGAPGTPEILNWVITAAAMSPTTMSLIDYIPCYRSLAGTGHGVTFGYWR
jgi:hypothetical protein